MTLPKGWKPKEETPTLLNDMTLPKGWKPKEETPILFNEEIIWRGHVMKGTIHKKVAEIRLITNMRVTQNNTVFNLSDLDDIIVMNQQYSSQDTRYYIGGVSTAYGIGQSRGTTIGDVVFIYQGKPVITFRRVRDPQGVASLAKTARKNAIQNANKIQEINTKIVKPINNEQSQKNDNNFPIDNSTIINNIIMCHKCGCKNKSDSNFCNECGNNLQIQITDKQISDKFLEYQSPRKIFKINYPAKWYKHDKKLPKGVWSINFTSQESLGVGVGVQILDYTLIEWIEVNIQDLKNKNSDFVLIESLPTTLANLPAHQFVYTESGHQALGVATKKGNTIYYIMYRAPKEKYLKFLPIAEQMISSFQFIE
jgi:hypothetical protein